VTSEDNFVVRGQNGGRGQQEEGDAVHRTAMLSNGTYRRPIPFPGSQLEGQVPGLADQVVAERAMRFFIYTLEARISIDVRGGLKVLLGPQGNLAITGLACEADTLVDEALAETQAARGGLDEQQ